MTDLLLQDQESRRAQLAARLRFEMLLADISARFVNVSGPRLDEQIEEAQRLLCEYLDIDRSSLWQTSLTEPRVLRLTHFHRPPGGPPVPDRPNLMDYFPWAAQRVFQGEVLIVADIDDLPPEASRDREVWERYGTKSALVFPLSAGGGQVFGVVSFASQRPIQWPAALVRRFELIAQVFANAISRSRADAALRESEERFRTLALNLPGVVYQLCARDNSRWGMSYVDARAADVCGLSPLPLETFFDRFAACVAPEDRGAWIESLRQAVVSGRGWEYEVKFIKPGGEEIYLRGFSEPRRSGEELIFSGVMRDITERKRAENKLRQTLGELKKLQEQLHHENVCLRQEVQSLQTQTPMVGNSDALRQLIAQAQQVAATDSTVLILGETGTGKELLARYLHSIGRRSSGPFVVSNIAAIPTTLLESELFGREKGAYTGALTRQIGRFEMADGGTLFLDEIGEMPPETQVKLLRVLQSGEFERLGSSRTLRANVQVIAATNRKLPELIRAGAFRQDLFYRLNVFPITLPPLRDRPEDIPMLVWAFVKEFSDRMGKPIERIRRKDLEALQSYHWPGNVRELRNVVERSMILTQGAELHLVLPDGAADQEPTGSRFLRDVERAHILSVLKSTGSRIRGPQGAAQILGVKPTTLYSLMERLGIERTK